MNVNAPKVSAARRLAANSSRSSSRHGEEHEEEDPELAEILDDALALHPTEHVRPHEQASQDHADYPGQADPLDEERAHEDHDRGDEEGPLGRGGRKLDAEEHARSVQLPPDGGRGGRGAVGSLRRR